MRARAFVAASLLAFAGCAAPPPADLGSVSAAQPRPASSTPGAPWSARELVRLHAVMNAALQSPFFAHAGIAIAGDDGRLLFARNATRGYSPASAMKILVAAAALGTLGADARLDTTFESLAEPDEQGRIDDLWLVGGGDPVLDPDQLRGGVGVLYRRGVRRVSGDLIVDATSFSGPEQNPAWAPDDFENSYAAGTSAISLNWNVIEFKIAPTQVGSPARVRIFPADPSIVVHGAPITGYSTTLRIERTMPGRNEFTIDGSIATGWEQSYYRPAAGIPLWAGEVAVAMLRERGIEFDGEVRLGGDPLAMHTLWEHRSPPLSTIVKQMMYESDNHIAEQLLRVLPGGGHAEQAYLKALGIPSPGLRIVDGSGLAESNRVAPVTLVRLLQAVAHSAVGDVYVMALPRAGIEGTVRRHALAAALGHVRAKSGHIADVNALVGYVETRRHGWLSFAFLVNAPGADDSTSIPYGIDRALDGLSEL